MSEDEAHDNTRPPLAREDTVLFVELDENGMRELVGDDNGNFPAPLEIRTQAKAMLAMMVDIDEVELGSKVGVIQIAGRGEDKQVTVHSEVDEGITRESYAYTEEDVTHELDAIHAEEDD